MRKYCLNNPKILLLLAKPALVCQKCTHTHTHTQTQTQTHSNICIFKYFHTKVACVQVFADYCNIFAHTFDFELIWQMAELYDFACWRRH